MCSQKIRTPKAEEFNRTVVFSLRKQSYIPSLSQTGQSLSSIYKKEQRGQDATPTFASDERSCLVWSEKNRPLLELTPPPFQKKSLETVDHSTYHSLFYFWSEGPPEEKE